MERGYNILHDAAYFVEENSRTGLYSTGGWGVTPEKMAGPLMKFKKKCSTESRTCVVTRTHSTFGDRAFAAVGPGLWNSLPPHLRNADLPYSRFRR